MKALKILILAGTVVGLTVLSGCNSGNIDSPDSAPVELEVSSLINAPITAESAGGGGGGGCTFEVVDWTVSFLNLPKNSQAVTSPFNDLIVDSVTIDYSWNSPGTTPQRTVGLGGIAVPVSGTGTATFSPITFEDLFAVTTTGGVTANLTLTFNARTIEGTTVRYTTGRQLLVESCPVP